MFRPLAFGERPRSVDVAWWAQLETWLSVHSYEVYIMCQSEATGLAV
jgi:hypothetical protein